MAREQLKLADWQARELAAKEAELVLAGACCRSCFHAGHRTLGVYGHGPLAKTVSCERIGARCSGAYWVDAEGCCAHWEARDDED